jgi:hypothetical protein
MSMRTIVSSLVVALVAVSCAAPAFAQAVRPERPYRGLFGSGSSDTEQALSVAGSLGAGYDDDLAANARGGNTANGGDAAPQSGSLGSGSAALNYLLNRGPVNLTALLGTSARYYPDAAESTVRSTQGLLTLGTSLGERTSLSASTTVTHQPYGFALLFPTLPTTEPTPVAPDLGPIAPVGGDTSYMAWSVGTGLSRSLSRRSTVSASYNYRQTDDSAKARFNSQGAGGQFAYTIARGFSLRLGYHQSRSEHEGREPIVYHTIDSGVDYGRTLSLSRRTSLTFGTGSSAIEANDRFHFRATGNARLSHEIGRSWSASAAYARNVSVQESLQEPVLSDAVSVGLGGLITRRLEFRSAAHAALGNVGVAQEDTGFDNYYASASLSYAFTRFMNGAITYAYYRHRFGNDVVLPVGVSSAVNRRSVSASVSLWAPLFQRARRINASR